MANSHLPQELIIEILLRMLVKTLLNCRCVCKSWFSLISHPDFATSHFQFAASPTNRLVFVGNYSETLSIDFNASLNNDSSYASLNLDFLPPQSCFRIGGSCRGFVFLRCYPDFYIWNPSTGVHKHIPPSPIVISSNHLLTFLYGFAYDHSTDDYSIVLGSCHYGASFFPVPNSLYFEIFSLRSNNWKKIEFANSIYEDDPRVGLIFNGAIHWLLHNIDTLKNVIVAFDIKETTMSEITLPDDFVAARYPNDCNLMVVGGLINAWMKDRHTVTIWVMQKYAVHSSWIKTLEFSVDPALHYSLSIVCFTDCGDIIGTNGGGGLMKFNDKGQLLEHHSTVPGNDSIRSEVALYTESLLSLPCDIEQF